MSSWSESMKQYEHSKRGSTAENNWQPAQRVSAQERKYREREFDIVAQQYRDPVREEMYTTMKLDTLKTKAVQYQEKSKGTHNIVTNVGPPKEKKTPIRDIPERDWNFLSHLPKEHQKDAPLFHNESFNQSYAHIPKHLKSLGGPKKPLDGREFNILSNKYHRNHDERVDNETNFLKDKIVDKYWRTHNYDPIRGKYFDPDKESEFQQQREVLKTVHGLAQVAKIAPSVKNTEGFAYDIVTNQSIDEDKINLLTAIKDRSLSKNKGHQIELAVKQRSDEIDALEESRRMSRLSFDRYKGPLELGYNPVNNMEYVYQPELKPRDPEAARLQKLQSTIKPRDLSGSPNVSGSLVHNTGRLEMNNQRDLSKSSSNGQIFESYQSARGGGGMQSSSNTLGTARNAMTSVGERSRVKPNNITVPSLNLSLAEQGPAVKYVEPRTGFASMQVSMVRTGGF